MTTLTPSPEAVDGPRTSNRATFFAALDWDGGRVEVVAGTNQANNPDKIDLITYDKATGRTTTRKWIAPDNVNGLEAHIDRLATQYGNVYVSVGTYDEVPNRHHPGTMTYNRSAPRPRRCFILDDVTDLSALRLPPTWATETSPGNYQVGYACIDLLSPKQSEMLGEGAMLLAGADPSGCDATQIIRVPSTLNTKYKCLGCAGDPKAGIEPEGWTVRLAFADGPRYTMQQLAEAFLPGGMTELGAAKHYRTGKVAKAAKAIIPDLEMLARLPDGAALMDSPRYRALFRARPQLAQLARGETVILPTKYGLRGSGSEQVAVLVVNLLTTGRSGPDKAIVAGLDAPPEDEIRAVALFWRERLRPGYDLGRYMQDVDRLISTYTPAGYAPEPTRITGESIPSRRALLPQRRPGRPYGSRDGTADALLAYCADLPADADGWIRTTTATLAKQFKLSLVHIGRLLADLRKTGQLESRTEPRAMALRLILKEGAFNDEGHHLFEGAFNDEGHHSPSQSALQCGITGDGVQGSNTPPPAPAVLRAASDDTTGAGCVLPISAEAEDHGVASLPDDAPLMITPEPVPVLVVGPPAPVGTVPGDMDALPPGCAFEPCDHTGYRTSYGVYWTVTGPNGRLDDVYTTKDSAAFWARRRWGVAPVLAPEPVPVEAPTPVENLPAPAPIAPQMPAQPAAGPVEMTIAAVVACIEVARSEIRRTLREKLDRDTGEITAKPLIASKSRVAALLGDVPPTLFDAAWKQATDEWQIYRTTLWDMNTTRLAATTRAAAQLHAREVCNDGPRVKFYAARAQIAAEICARRGVDPLDPTLQKRPVTQIQAKAKAKGQTDRRSAITNLFIATSQGSQASPPAYAGANTAMDNISQPSLWGD
ncbi:MAG: hypothetical protein WCK70_03500 [Chloroflexales bacterium]|jgi:RepB DNA-primase from phage plasmid